MRNLRTIVLTVLFLAITAPYSIAFGENGSKPIPNKPEKSLGTLIRQTELSCTTVRDALTYASSVQIVIPGQSDADIWSSLRGRLLKDVAANPELDGIINVDNFAFVPEMSREIVELAKKSFPGDEDKQMVAIAYLIKQGATECKQRIMERKLKLIGNSIEG